MFKYFFFFLKKKNYALYCMKIRCELRMLNGNEALKLRVEELSEENETKNKNKKEKHNEIAF